MPDVLPYQSERARLAKVAAFAAPAILLVGLALAGGGFDLDDRHVAGLAAWLVVIGLIVLGGASSARLGRAAFVTAGTITSLAGLDALSAVWSGSAERSVIEADRTLAYLGFFLAAFLIAQTPARRARFAEGLAVGLGAVAVIGLLSRLVPDAIEWFLDALRAVLPDGAIAPLEDPALDEQRLRYPLGYWNANGSIFGLALVMLLWASRGGGWTALRWLAAALLPATTLALYFTYSRGGVVTAAVALGCLLALSRDRLWYAITAAMALIATAPVVLAVQARRALADGQLGELASDQGLTVFVYLLLGTAALCAVLALVGLVERRPGPAVSRLVAISRNRTVLNGIGAAALVVIVVLAGLLGGRAWDRFSETDLQFPARSEAHFTELTGAGRYEYWSTALGAFGDKPVLGQGAGSFEFWWEGEREIAQPVRDAHSLYLEGLAELGLAGGLLTLALMLVPIAAGAAAWRRAAGHEREMAAALLAALVGFAVATGFDWFWELAGLGAVFFCAAGVLVALSCAQLGTSAREGPGRQGRLGGYGAALAALAIAWVSAAALIGPLLVDRSIDASQAAAREGDIAGAIDHAETARSIEPWAASPYLQLGLLAELEGDYPTAIERLDQAIAREEGNWQLFYIRSRVHAAAGHPVAARRDHREAERLNPLAEVFVDE